MNRLGCWIAALLFSGSFWVLLVLAAIYLAAHAGVRL